MSTCSSAEKKPPHLRPDVRNLLNSPIQGFDRVLTLLHMYHQRDTMVTTTRRHHIHPLDEWVLHASPMDREYSPCIAPTMLRSACSAPPLAVPLPASVSLRKPPHEVIQGDATTIHFSNPWSSSRHGSAYCSRHLLPSLRTCPCKSSRMFLEMSHRRPLFHFTLSPASRGCKHKRELNHRGG